MSHQDHERGASALIVRFAVLTLSDTRTPETDTTGQAAREMIAADGHIIAAYTLIRDEPEVLRHTLDRWLDDASIDAIVTNGGTGISRRDTAMPTIKALFDSEVPGFGELFRKLSFDEIGPSAMLSRAAAGVSRGKFLAALPGSTAAVKLALRELLLPQIRHIVSELRR